MRRGLRVMITGSLGLFLDPGGRPRGFLVAPPDPPPPSGDTRPDGEAGSTLPLGLLSGDSAERSILTWEEGESGDCCCCSCCARRRSR